MATDPEAGEGHTTDGARGAPSVAALRVPRTARGRSRRLAAGPVVALVTALGASWTCAAAAATGKISPSFRAKADKTCAAIVSSYRKVGESKFPYTTFTPVNPQKSLLKKVGRYFDKGLSITESVPAKIQALGEPATGAATWNTLRRYADAEEALGVTQTKDALAGDAKGFVAAVKKITAVVKKLNTAATSGGFSSTSSCSTLFG